MFWYFDPLYLVFALPALLFAFYAQYKVQSAYNRYTRVANSLGITGWEAAQRLLRSGRLYHVQLDRTPGHLTDHYDPRSKTLRLSDGVARVPSVASLAIVAHEVGHALQDEEGYALLRLRGGLVPVVNLGSWLGPILFVIGFFFLGNYTLAWLGVIFFSGAFLFALVTLPVELNASSRAIALLRSTGLIVSPAEEKGARAVLTAAALTYVAAVAQALSTLLYYIFLLSGSRRRD